MPIDGRAIWGQQKVDPSAGRPDHRDVLLLLIERKNERGKIQKEVFYLATLNRLIPRMEIVAGGTRVTSGTGMGRDGEK